MEFNDKQMRILQAAEKYFAEKGFDGASIRDIASEANVNIAMISYYFGSKEKLLEQLIIFRASDLKMQLENLLKENVSPLEKLEKVIALYLARINKNKCIYQIVHFEINSQKRSMNFKAFADVKRSNLQSLEKLVREGQEKGIFTKNVNVALIPTTIVGTYFHFNMNKPFYEELLGLTTEKAFDSYLKNELTQHIQQTIKALLTNEK
jgi:AcrR family transcriptional regulator